MLIALSSKVFGMKKQIRPNISCALFSFVGRIYSLVSVYYELTFLPLIFTYIQYVNEFRDLLLTDSRTYRYRLIPNQRYS